MLNKPFIYAMGLSKTLSNMEVTGSIIKRQISKLIIILLLL